MRPTTCHKWLASEAGCEAGFTLVEMIMVIAISGIVAAFVAVFIRTPVQGYIDAEARAQLTDVADTALRRMSRDVRLALPNSVRTTINGGVSYMELLLTKTGGRYLSSDDAPDATYPPLSFSDTTKLTFRIIGPMPTGVQAIAANDYVVVNNSGQVPLNAYQYPDCAATGCNIVKVSAVNNGTQVVTLASNPFGQLGDNNQSFGKHFHIVSGPVTYACNPATGTLTRYWDYAIAAAQPTAFVPASSSSAILATGVTACAFSYGNLASARAGLVGISLTLQTAGTNSGAVTLFEEVHMDNTP